MTIISGYLFLVLAQFALKSSFHPRHTHAYLYIQCVRYDCLSVPRHGSYGLALKSWSPREARPSLVTIPGTLSDLEIGFPSADCASFPHHPEVPCVTGKTLLRALEDPREFLEKLDSELHIPDQALKLAEKTHRLEAWIERNSTSS